MPAKRPAQKSTKGKKAASRPAVRKALPHKPDGARARGVAAAHGRKSAIAAPPRKALDPQKKTFSYSVSTPQRPTSCFVVANGHVGAS